MMPHRWYPHALIQRHHGRPIFDSGFNFTDFHTTRRLVRGGSLEVLDSLELESTHYAFGTNYTVDVRTGELRLILEYDESALARSTVALAAEAHRRALAAILADPDVACRSAPLPGAADLARLIEHQLGRQEHDDPAPVNGSSLVRASRPDAVAVRPVPAEEEIRAPRTPLEHSVRRVWAEVLGEGDYGLHTSFFEVGGSSLTAMQVVSRLRAKHGKLSMGTFMDAPTIADTARALGASQPSSADALPSSPEVTGPADDRSRRYPASPAQHQMWLLTNRLPGLALFGMPGALRADGPLNLDVLERTLASLIRRHDALRTRFLTTDAGLEQVVAPHAAFDIETVDLSRHADPIAHCETLMAAAVREPFVLDRAPLMRAVVYRIGDDRHVIYLNIHHMVCDGWSLAQLLREAARTYRDLAAGAERLDRPILGSGQLTQARMEWVASSAATEQRAYWVDRLAPPWPSLAGGRTSRLRRAGAVSLLERFRSATCRRRMDASVGRSLREAAAAHGLTDFMIVLTAYALTLRSWSGQDDIRIATMLANRADPGTEDVVGLVANTAVLRMDVGENADAVDQSRHVRRVCLEAYDHQELPFEDVLKSLETRYPPEARTGPLFEVMLVMQEETPEVDASEGLTLAPYISERGPLSVSISPTTCDFILAVTRAGDEIVLDLQYKPAITASTVALELLDDMAATLVATTRTLRERQ
jgi:aryl carrier-like protein